MHPASRTRLCVACVALAALAVPIAARAQGLGGGGMGEQPRRKAPPKVVTAAAARAWIKLQQPVPMPFRSETPLADVIKYIKQATADKDLPAGLAIYLDPKAINPPGAEKPEAPTVSLNLEGVPLATSLNLLANQLGLAFGVQKDGVVIIGHRSPATPEVGAAPVTEAEARTWLRLQEVAPVPFAKPTPLADVVAFLQQQSAGKDHDAGLPVYLDPGVITEGGEQRVTLKLDAAPLRTALGLMLDQLNLTYRVQQDGILVITSPEEAISYDPPPQRGMLAGGMGGMGGMGGGMMGGMGGMMGGVGGGTPPRGQGASAGASAGVGNMGGMR